MTQPKTFSASGASIVHTKKARNILMKASVKTSSLKTYERNLKLLCAFLANIRKTRSVPVETCSEKEFLSLLVSWKAQGLCSPAGIWNALAFAIRCNSVQSPWLFTSEMRKMVIGAGREGKHEVRGVLTPQMTLDFMSLIKNESDIGRNCSWCTNKELFTIKSFETCSVMPPNYFWKHPFDQVTFVI